MIEQEAQDRLLRSYAAQLIDAPDGVVLKRGLTEIKFGGSRPRELLEGILNLTQGNGASGKEILTAFAAPDHEAVQTIVRHLLNRNILYYADGAPDYDATAEDAADRFFWHFLKSKAQVQEQLAPIRLTVLGVNSITRQLVASLLRTGFEDIETIDLPLLRNHTLFSDGDEPDLAEWPSPASTPIAWERSRAAANPNRIDCLIAAVDRGGQHLLREWNSFCVNHNRRFFPILLQDMVGGIGPYVIPGDTACLECLRARQNSHLENPEERRMIEFATVEGAGVEAFIPPMGSILGDIAAVELLKLYTGIPQTRVGHYIEVNLLSMKLTNRYVLKIPRCPTCSPIIEKAPMTSKKSLFMPGNPYEESLRS